MVAPTIFTIVLEVVPFFVTTYVLDVASGEDWTATEPEGVRSVDWAAAC